MTTMMKPLACDPKRIKGMSETLIVSHYENNYGGAVKRLNAITEQLAALDFATAPGFVVNGLKREELIAGNSMVLHEIFFASLGEGGEPGGGFRAALARDFGTVERWRTEFATMGKAQAGGSGWVLRLRPCAPVPRSARVPPHRTAWLARLRVRPAFAVSPPD
jgi:Fe-Mn family superoxide dismutase